MVDIREHFTGIRRDQGQSDPGQFYAPSYSEIVTCFAEILLEVEQSDYQGDTLYLLRANGKYGYLQVGWGSCSGCDALQGCDDWDDLQRLANDLESDIKWFDTGFDAVKYMKEHDWKGSHLDRDLRRRFPEQALEILDTFQNAIESVTQ